MVTHDENNLLSFLFMEYWERMTEKVTFREDFEALLNTGQKGIRKETLWRVLYVKINQ